MRQEKFLHFILFTSNHHLHSTTTIFASQVFTTVPSCFVAKNEMNNGRLQQQSTGR